MPSDSNNLPRITFSIGSFEEKVVVRMAERREVSKSEIIRNLVQNWIETNSELLKKNYGINLEEMTREMRLESSAHDLFEEIINSFKRTKKIHIDRLAEKIDVNSKDLLRYIDKNGDVLEKKGLNLQTEGEYIIKI